MSDSLATSNNNLIPLPILITIISNLEQEKNNLEHKLKECEKKYNELKITADGYLETVHGLREEKTMLCEKNARLETQIIDLTAENDALKKRVFVLENEIEKIKIINDETNKELKFAQCVYDYKQKLKLQISSQLPDRWELFDILQGDYDSNLTSTELEVKNSIVVYINKTHNNIKEFKRALKDMTKTRLVVAHPDVSTEYKTLQPEFLNYCNAKWPRDVEYNKIFTDDIFNKLTE